MPDKDSLPLDFKRRAYNYIIDQYFLNQTAQDSILDDGDPVGFPVTGNTKAVFDFKDSLQVALQQSIGNVGLKEAGSGAGTDATFYGFSSKAEADSAIYSLSRIFSNSNSVILDNLSSVLISQMRSAFAYQTYGEILAQGGIRDNEVLLSFFGIAPSDEALGRPYYIGVDRTNIITSEVMQTAPTDTQPLGTLGGHGMGVSRSREIRYHAKEYCVIMCLGYFIPDSFYTQGMPREDTLKSKYDWGQPVFQHLSEQPVYGREILCASEEKVKKDYTSAGKDDTAASYNSKIFGYRPYADFWREDFNTCSGLFHMEQFWKDFDNTEQVANLSH